MSSLMGLIPFPGVMKPDIVTIVAPDTTVDPENFPSSEEGIVGLDLSCCVCETVFSGQGSAMDVGPVVVGLAQREIYFDANPQVTGSLQILLWKHNRFGVIDPPIKLISTGRARPPQGISQDWVVSTTETT